MNEHKVNAEKIRNLLKILPEIQGMDAQLTITISAEELAKLPKKQCASFLDSVAKIAVSMRERKGQS